MRFKKILVILGLVIVLLFGVALIVTYLNYSKAKKVDNAVVFKNYFPFGLGNILTNTPNIPSTPNTIIDTGIPNAEPNSKLIRVSDQPVAGYTFVQKEFYPDSEPTTETTPKTDTVTVTPVGEFTSELKFGSRGPDVKRLQQTLNMCPELGLAQTGPGSAGKETEVYVERTFDAVKRFQIKFKDDILTPQKLTEPSGILDELTRKKLSSPFVCKTTVSTTFGSPKVKPGAVLKTVVRYIEKATGNVYDFLPEKRETGRLTNQTIPRITEAMFGENGNKVFIRYVKEDNQTIETYFADVPKQVLGGDGAEGELTGKFLPRDINDLALNPSKTTAFMQSKIGTNASGLAFDLATSGSRQFFSSPFPEWLSQWVKDDPKNSLITMTTKASGYVPGFMFKLDTKTGSMTKVLGNIFGLTTNTNPDFTKILFSKSTDRGFIFGMHDLKDGKNYNLQVTTLPEKCTWSKTGGTIYCGVPRLIPGGAYPDDWYQGTAHMSDQIVRIDPTQLYENEILVDPEEEGVSIDTVNIQVDDSERYTAFIDKTTGILYMVLN